MVPDLTWHGCAQLHRALLATTMLAGASSSVGSLGAAVAVEREMPAVLCAGNAASLSKLNAGAVLRRPAMRATLHASTAHAWAKVQERCPCLPSCHVAHSTPYL